MGDNQNFISFAILLLFVACLSQKKKKLQENTSKMRKYIFNLEIKDFNAKFSWFLTQPSQRVQIKNTTQKRIIYSSGRF